jgi:hypothetical protein
MEEGREVEQVSMLYTLCNTIKTNQYQVLQVTTMGLFLDDDGWQSPLANGLQRMLPHHLGLHVLLTI